MTNFEVDRKTKFEDIYSSSSLFEIIVNNNLTLLKHAIDMTDFETVMSWHKDE